MIRRNELGSVALVLLFLLPFVAEAALYQLTKNEEVSQLVHNKLYFIELKTK